jgi:ABC-type multidrug transport system ATPase subunit
MSIEFNNILYKYPTGKFELFLNDIKIEPSSITCVIGPNGMGKTTMLYLLANLYKPQKGCVIIDGLNYKENSLEIFKNSYFSVDYPTFYENLSGYSNLKIQCLYRNITEKRIKEVFDIVGIENNNKKYKMFSAGMKQKLNIAASLLSNPKLIVLDEPFNGLDPGAVINLKKILIDLNENNGTTIVISTHLLNEADSFCTNYCIMDNGKIVENRKFDNSIEKLESIYKSAFFID